VRYFSGFSLKGEEILFDHIIDQSNFSVIGFSYGAIKALEYVKSTHLRIDKLQLISPAFFQTQSEKFKRLQLIHYQKDREAYVNNFLKNIASPSSVNLQKYYHESSIEALDELLNYQWNIDDLLAFKAQKITIEVHLGAQDKIIESQKAKEFFEEVSDIFWYNHQGHVILNENKE
jgi:esterase/lipase